MTRAKKNALQKYLASPKSKHPLTVALISALLLVVGGVIVLFVTEPWKARVDAAAQPVPPRAVPQRAVPKPSPPLVAIPARTVTASPGATSSNDLTGELKSLPLDKALPGSTLRFKTLQRTHGKNGDTEQSAELLYVAPKNPVKPTSPPRFQANFFFEASVDALVAGDPEKAVEDASQALSLVPNDAASYNNLGVGRFLLEDFRGAVIDWKAAVRLDPESIDYRANLIEGIAALDGSIAGSSSDPLKHIVAMEETRVQADELVRLHPDNDLGYVTRAGVDLDIGHLPELRADIQQIATHNPTAGQVASFEGYLKSAEGKAVEAIVYYRVATQQNPHFPNVYLQWAAAENSLGHRDKAIVLLRKAIALKPRLRNALQNRRNRHAWGALAGDPRFQSLAASQPQP